MEKEKECRAVSVPETELSKHVPKMIIDDDISLKDPKLDCDNNTVEDGVENECVAVSVTEAEQKLLDQLQQIPTSEIELCFEMNLDLFKLRLKEAVEEKKNLLEYLRKVHAKYLKWKDKVFPTLLPEYVSIPSKPLQKWFNNKLKEDNILFRVQKIEGDGNCLYRSLSENSIIKQRIPKFITCEPYRYVRDEMNKFAVKNKDISFLIWKLYVDKNFDLNDEELCDLAYQKWLDSLKRNTTWGGQAEYVLFAYTFQIHVICIRQLQYEVEVVCTKIFQPSIGNQKTKTIPSVTSFGKFPIEPKDVLFIWHHIMTNPRRKLTGGYCNGNHYSYLELDSNWHGKTLSTNTFCFQHINQTTETQSVNLLTPDVSNPQSTLQASLGASTRTKRKGKIGGRENVSPKKKKQHLLQRTTRVV
jgi:hypothetical protein